ncbi:branched-chain amino acid ABC transporter permease [Sulfitobacter sp. HNIBRBA3233]|uniref:branched-chain amino acid ABC transporter permease n=1 Tax=Sulfitobacter marinivivus TaxID=3158558 RepID=UPI0032DFEC57
MTVQRFLPILAILALIVMVLAPLGLDPRGYEMRILCIMLLFAGLGQAWNIVGGLANQISLGHAAYFGIGAYTSTILLNLFTLSPWLGGLFGMVLAVGFALLLSIPTVRLKGHYYALATLAAGEAMRVIANSWADVTGGPVGISVPYMPGEGLWMMQFSTVLPNYYLFLAALVVICLIFWKIQTGALGYRLRAIKQNEQAAEVIGVDTYRAKLIAACVSAAITAFLGTLYAQFQFFFDPDTVFGIATISVKMALIAILGGVGRLSGPLVGAAFIIPMEEMANSYFGSSAAGLSQFAYGAILVIVILLNPHGLTALIGQLWNRILGKGAPHDRAAT